MTQFTRIPKQVEAVLELHGTSRRKFLRTSGLFVVSLSSGVRGADTDGGTAKKTRGLYPDPDFRQLDSWIVIHSDGTATFYVGKTDCGQGTGTAFRQIMS